MFWKKKLNKIITPGISSGIEKSIVKLLGTKGLPPAPIQAQKAFELSLKTDIDAKDIINLVENEETLSAKVLKIANSAYFGRKEKTETIPDAVIVVGVEELKNILCANALKNLFPSKLPFREKLWKHNVAVALIAKIISERTDPKNKDKAFLAGLMHDIGKLLLFQRFESAIEEIYKDAAKSDSTYLDVEEAEFLCNHCEVGFMIGQKWNFTEYMLHAICFHHKPWNSAELLNQNITRMVKASNIISYSNGEIEFPAKTYFKNKNEGHLTEALKEIGIAYVEKDSLLKRVKKSLTEELELYL